MLNKPIALFFSLVLIGFSLTTQAKTVIRVTLQLPQSHFLGQNWLDFKHIIEANSDGELQLQLFPSAQLFKDKQVPEAVGSGAIEAGSAFLGRFSGLVPIVNVINLPFFFKNPKSLAEAVSPKSEVRKLIDQSILKESGARVLWWQAYDRSIYLSKKVPIRTPNDLKGLKVRTYGKVPSWTVEALGGAPTIMSGSKQFLAYQQGAVDAGMTGTSAVQSRKLYEVMNYLTLSFDSAIEFIAIINNDFFNSLSSRHQKIILKAASRVEKKLRQEVSQKEQQSLNSVANKIKLISLSKAQRQQWQQATKSVVGRFIKEVGEPAQKIVTTASKYR